MPHDSFTDVGAQAIADARREIIDSQIYAKLEEVADIAEGVLARRSDRDADMRRRGWLQPSPWTAEEMFAEAVLNCLDALPAASDRIAERMADAERAVA